MKRLNKFLPILMAAGALFCFHGCDDDEEVSEAASLTLSNDAITLQAVDAVSQKLIIKSTAVWTAECSASWLDVSPDSGDGDAQVTITASDNTVSSGADTEARSATVTFHSADATLGNVVVSVSQKGYANLYLTLGSSSLSFAASSAESQTVTVSSNTGWSVVSSASWVSVSPSSGEDDGTVTVTVSDNVDEVTTYERTATLTFTSDDESLEETVAISQEGQLVPAISVSPTSLSFEASSTASQTITVTCNTDWTAVAADDWVTISAASGSGDGTVTVTVSDNVGTETTNARTSSVTFTTTDLSVSATTSVSQDGQVVIPAGTYFSDDFEWLDDWANYSLSGLSKEVGKTVEDNNPDAYCPLITTPKIDGVSTRDTLLNRGYQFLRVTTSGTTTTEIVYLQRNYLKFGKTNYQAGIILPPISGVPSGAELYLSFNWCPMRQGSGTIDPVELVVIVENDEVETQFEVPVSGWESGHTLEWIKAEIALTGMTVTESTVITIRNSDDQWPISKAERWFLDNIILYSE